MKNETYTHSLNVKLSGVGGILELDDFSFVCDDFALRHLH